MLDAAEWGKGADKAEVAVAKELAARVGRAERALPASVFARNVEPRNPINEVSRVSRENARIAGRR